MFSFSGKGKVQPGAGKKPKRRRFNWVVSDVARNVLKRAIEWGARLRGQRFYCNVLAGESRYDLTINCDLTLSCTCQDYDGSGHLGDLNKNSMQEIFFGPVAQRFRRELAQGKLPIKTCTRCGDLHRAPKSQVTKEGGTPVYAGPKPRLPHVGILLENTVRCNIDCIGCDRQSAARIRTSLQMDLEKLSRMADLIHDLGMEEIYYLNLGEPFLSPNIGQELPLLRRKNPDCRIVISTNGIILNNDVKREAALSASHIYFSIAGINDEMLKKYEHLGSFEKAYQNMKALVDYRNARGLSKPLLEWKYLLFNWNDHPRTLDRAVEMARAAGVDTISIWPTGNPFYGISYRYRLGLLNHLGVACWKGREIDLRPASRAPATVLA
ncbi:Radical SAM domain protein [Verrucomicrobia bacterium]|nr:Radical SAM domain protein [Verrucomicrobiota bacterium]